MFLPFPDIDGEEFVCSELMCGAFGGTCVCKVARWLSQTGPALTKLTSLSLADNNLKVGRKKNTFTLKRFMCIGASELSHEPLGQPDTHLITLALRTGTSISCLATSSVGAFRFIRQSIVSSS